MIVSKYNRGDNIRFDLVLTLGKLIPQIRGWSFHERDKRQITGYRRHLYTSRYPIWLEPRSSTYYWLLTNPLRVVVVIDFFKDHSIVQQLSHLHRLRSRVFLTSPPLCLMAQWTCSSSLIFTTTSSNPLPMWSSTRKISIRLKFT